MRPGQSYPFDTTSCPRAAAQSRGGVDPGGSLQMRSKLTLAFACACALGGRAGCRRNSPGGDDARTAYGDGDRDGAARDRPVADPAEDRQIPPRDLAVAADDGRAGSLATSRTRPRRSTRRSRSGSRSRQDAARCPESAPQAAVALHPPLRGLMDRPESAVLRRPADGSRVPAHATAGGCSHARGRRTTGRRSSRCGLPSERTVPAAGFYPWPNTARYCGLI